MSDKKQCEYVSPRAQIRCQRDAGHGAWHMAWNDDGIPVLKMGDATKESA